MIIYWLLLWHWLFKTCLCSKRLIAKSTVSAAEFSVKVNKNSQKSCFTLLSLTFVNAIWN